MGLRGSPFRCYRRQVDTQAEAGAVESSNPTPRTVLVTGGCGFIGSNLVRLLLHGGAESKAVESVVNLDKLTYAGRLENLEDVAETFGDRRYFFVRGDICDGPAVARVFAEHQPDMVVHLAAESHVDRSITAPQAFIRTNVEGTLVMLEAARHYWSTLAREGRERFRFLHVSTDEVYGTLEAGEPAFTERSLYAPRSPYAASKAGADHLVRAHGNTYGLPVILSNCSNNYGPYQLPEKLIPLMIRFALTGRHLPVYGDGQQVRDWVHVEDHCRALRLLLERGSCGETYNIGGSTGAPGTAGSSERTNLQIAETVCRLLDAMHPRKQGGSYAEQIRFVADRPGHDRRYGVDASKLQRTLGWSPRVSSVEAGLAETVAWYLEHGRWVESVSSSAYKHWITENYDWRDPE